MYLVKLWTGWLRSVRHRQSNVVIWISAARKCCSLGPQSSCLHKTMRLFLPSPRFTYGYIEFQVYHEFSPCLCEIQLASTYLLTYLLNSMVQSPSWEANWFAASQEIPRISRNPKVHYRTHKRPPHVSILGQPNPVHIPTSHLLEIHPNIIHPSTPRSPQWSLSFRFPHQDPIHPPYLHPYAPHAQPISN